MARMPTVVVRAVRRRPSETPNIIANEVLMIITVRDCVWDVDEIMNVEEIDYETACKQNGLPLDDFMVEVDYEIEDPANGPTDDEFSELDDLVADAVTDKYGFCIDGCGWDIFE